MVKSFILCLVVFTASYVQASPTRHISISDIIVKIPAKQQQKNPFPQAVNKGKRKAFDKMLLGFSRQLIDPNITDQEIGGLIAKVQIDKEVRAKAAYTAKLTYFFKRERVDQFVLTHTKHLDVPHILPKTTLLLPLVIDNDGKPVLWGEQNKWRKAWLKKAQKLPVILPLGDLQDMRIIKAQQVANFDTTKLTALMQKYHCSECVIVSATLRPNMSPHQKADFKIKALKQSHKIEIDELSLTAQSRDALFDEAITIFEKEIQKFSAQKAVQHTNPKNVMTAISVNVPFETPGSYYKVEDCLKKIGLIDHIETESLSLKEARLKLFCHGDRGALEKALKEQKLFLKEIENKLILLEKREVENETQPRFTEAAIEGSQDQDEGIY